MIIFHVLSFHRYPYGRESQTQSMRFYRDGSARWWKYSECSLVDSWSQSLCSTLLCDIGYCFETVSSAQTVLEMHTKCKLVCWRKRKPVALSTDSQLLDDVPSRVGYLSRTQLTLSFSGTETQTINFTIGNKTNYKLESITGTIYCSFCLNTHSPYFFESIFHSFSLKAARTSLVSARLTQ